MAYWLRSPCVLDTCHKLRLLMPHTEGHTPEGCRPLP